jgi:hypothetical protein
MNPSCCEVCGQIPSVHVIEIRDGQRVERNFCDKHADLRGVPGLSVGAGGRMVANGVPISTIQDAAATGVIRGMANFARRHGRLPDSVDEIEEGMALRGEFPKGEIADDLLTAKLTWIDGLLEFFRTHGRLPETPEEMPPMPPGIR